MKKLIFFLFFLTLINLSFSQTRTDVINACKGADKNWTSISQVMPDWSECFSIDNEFSIDDITKYRWIFLCSYITGWNSKIEVSFDNYIPLFQKYYKICDSNYRLESTTFSILAETRPGYFLFSPFSKEREDELYQKISNNTYTDPYFLNSGKYYSKVDGEVSSIKNIEGEYNRAPGSLNPEIYGINDRVFIVPINDSDFTLSVSISDYNNKLLNQGYHFLAYNEKQHILISDSTIGKYYRDGQLIGDDSFSIRILSFNDKAKVLLLETSSFSIPLVPVEDFFINSTRSLERSSGISKIVFYEAPDFSASIISESSEKESFLVLDDSQPVKLQDNVYSKWLYIEGKKSGIKGWVWGMNLTINDFSVYDLYMNARYCGYFKLP